MTERIKHIGEGQTTYGNNEPETSKARGILDDLEFDNEYTNLPQSFNITRSCALQSPGISRELVKKFKEKACIEYTVSNKKLNICESDFCSFQIIASQLVFNHNYIKEHKPKAEESKDIPINEELSRKMGKDCYVYPLKTNLNTICRYMYGDKYPTVKHQKSVLKMLEGIRNVDVKLKIGSIEYTSPICMCRFLTDTNKKIGETKIALLLDPIFVEGLKNNFGSIPQDAIVRLRSATESLGMQIKEQHFHLLTLLAVQKENKITRSIGELVKLFGKEKEYTKNRGRVEERILDVCKVLKEAKLLSSYTTEYEKGKTDKAKKILRITFERSPDFKKEDVCQIISF